MKLTISSGIYPREDWANSLVYEFHVMYKTQHYCSSRITLTEYQRTIDPEQERREQAKLRAGVWKEVFARHPEVRDLLPAPT